MPGFSLAESKTELREQRRQEIYREFLFQVQRASFIQDKRKCGTPLRHREGKVAAGTLRVQVLCLLQREFAIDSARTLIILTSVCEGFPDTLL